MWHLNQQFEANRQKLAKLEQQKAEGMNISDARLTEAREQVARDVGHAAAIERALAEQQAQADAELQRVEERRRALVQAAQEAYKRLARSQWPGTQAQFDAAWPELLRDWQMRQTTDATAALAASLPRIRL